jgi:hypothetical protein
MKILFAFFLFQISLFGMAQTVSSTSSSAVSDSTLYVVDGKILAGEALRQIPYEKISSVEVVKKDTVVNGKIYRDRIYVRLKKEENLEN